jgi:hypothetical protein
MATAEILVAMVTTAGGEISDSDTTLNVMVEWLTFLLRIREIKSLNLGTHIAYSEIFQDFHESFQADSRVFP